MTDPAEKEKLKWKKLLKELGRIKGRHTELVTVYVPVGYNLAEMVNTLRTEQGTAVNIKSKSVRNNVVDALGKIVQALGYFKKTPPNGLAIFCGNVSEKEGVADLKIWVEEPPEPLRTKLYWCSQAFDLEPLREMVEEKEVYGIINIDRSEADVALLVGKKIDSLYHEDSIVPGKSRAGGQSSTRFSRVREGLKHDFFKDVAEAANKIFMDHKEVIGIIVSGPGPTKEEFLREELLFTDVRKKIIGTVNTSYTGDFGLSETVERASELLKESAVVKERNLLQEFFGELQKPRGLAVYGLKEVIDAMKNSSLEKLIISEQATYREFEYECGHEKGAEFLPLGQKPGICATCGQQKRVIHDSDLLDVIDTLAGDYGTKVATVSADTREGQQFLAIGGIGGYLRYKT